MIYSKEWFGKVHKSSEVVDALWTQMVKYPKDKTTGEYDYSKSPSISVKIPQWEGVWRSEIYDEDGEKLYPGLPNITPLDYLKKGSNVMCLIKFAGIWFVNGKFSASWQLVQAVVQKPRAELKGQCFLKVKQSDKDKLKTQVVVEEDVEETYNASSVQVEDDEVEEDVKTVVEPPPSVFVAPAEIVAPVVEEVKKKKIVRKKTAEDN